MKTKRIVLVVSILAVAACAFMLGRLHDQRAAKLEAVASAHELLQAKKYYEALEQASLAAYTKYYFGDPPAQYAAAKELVRLTEGADPKVWQYMDWGTYNAEIYARASIAAELTERKAEAQEFRRLAVLAWIKRKIWNYAYQQMIAMTTSQDFDKAESELFTMIKSMDQAIRAKKAE
jgi:hypothetical protein